MADREKLSKYLRKVTGELRGAQQRALELEHRAHEPIAIVGMACRYPGEAKSTEALWELLASGADATSAFPDDRGWQTDRLYDADPDVPGTSYVRTGGFLPDAGEFDAEFFELSPREALATDPQQRQLLEVAWEALEEACIDPSSLGGSETGVFAGVMSQDYGAGAGGASADLEDYVVGTAASAVSGRVAYALGLQGPTVTVDTACSSSLVAVHLASQALRNGECALALAGGVTVLATPSVFVEFSRQRGLALDGRCKSFADAADGTGFSEGVGVLALERLSDAERNGHPILATIRGSAVNQDGASSGLTAPNGPAQERVIRQALANARLTYRDVDAVEAHGTGTTLGDPIEAGALLATYGQDREVPLRLGSIKSNIGHTQAAAGVAGVIKMVMALREGVLPRTLHVDAVTSRVDWGSGGVELLTEDASWEANGRPRRAGVSSFGASGTNAHVILEEAPEPSAIEAGEGMEGEESTARSRLLAPILLPLSAKAEPALAEVAERLAAHLQESPLLDPIDVAYSLATTRAAFERRAVVLGGDYEELLASLSALANGEPSANLISARAEEGKLAYLLSGQGPQRLGMGRELYEQDTYFAEAFDKACEQIDAHLDASLKDIVFAKGKKAEERLKDTTYAQPALFAIEAALHEALAKRGLKPDLLTGHSVGEIAAAQIAGVLSLPDAAKLVVARGRLMGALPKGGAMVAIEATEQEATESIEGREAELSIAGINSPSSIVLSGAEEAIEEAEDHWQSEGRKTKRLAVSHAFHSPLMEPMLEEFAEVAQSLTFNEPQIPVISNLTGEILSKEQATDPAYWVSHAREPVRFAQGIETLASQGVSAYLELGPDPVLLAMARECLTGSEAEAAFIPALRKGRSEAGAIQAALAHAHAVGAKLDWQAFFEDTGARRVPLPTYPFQRKRYWLDSAGSQAGDMTAAGQAAADHPLLGAAVELAGGEDEGVLLTGRISLSTHAWLADHVVGEAVLLPGTAFLELALRAGEQVGAETVEELTLEAPLILPEGGAVAIQVSVKGLEEDGRREVAIHSRIDGEEDAQWTRNATGALSDAPAPAPEPQEVWPPEGAEPIEVDYLYDRLAEAGLEYGPAFQGLTAAYREGERIYTEVSLPEEQAHEAQRFAIHPALLDAALHGISLAKRGSGTVELPWVWSGVSLQAEGAHQLRVCLTPTAESVGLQIADGAGAPLATVSSLALRQLDPSQLQGTRTGGDGLLELGWTELALPEQEEAPEQVEILRPEIDAKAPSPEAARRATEQTLEAIQNWLADESKAELRLALITQGAMATSQEESPDPAAAAIWGLVRSAQSEHPGRFALIDTDGTDASEEAMAKALELGEAEPQLALRKGAALVPRLIRTKPGEEEEDSLPPIDPQRTVLITGATGVIGALVARHLAEHHGARHLLLTSRSGSKAKGARRLKRELEALGAKARIAACDVADRKTLEKLLASIPKEHPLGAVIHCAGVLADGTVESLDAGRIERVFAPKVDGAWNLHELTADADLTAFVLFSSVAGALGGPGQANYAAANVFLDALAQRRQRESLPATSVAWGLWEQESGMTSGLDEADRARMRRSGLAALSNERGLELFDAALGAGRAQAVAVSLDTGDLRALAAAGDLPQILRAIVRAPRRRAAAGGSFGAKLAGLSEGEREDFVLALVRGEAAAVLGHASPEAIDPSQSFKQAGFDSLAAVELRNRLSAVAGFRLPATVVFDWPNCERLSAHLLAEATATSGEEKRVAVRAPASDEPIAIVGMACRYPGGIASPGELWRLVAAGGDAIGEFPRDRSWDLERLYHPDPDNPGTSYTREGGFLPDAAEFDAEFFGIAPREALATDPQQRLLLESCWEALEDAGIDPASLHGEPAGVFAGVMHQDYAGASAEEADGYRAIGGSASIVSGRVAYSLGLEGPAISVDTACSSSLVAMHLASQALRGGECTLALAGGVTAIATPDVFSDFSRQRGLAPDGRSKSFAEAADGVAWSEGVGVLVLERLSEAKRKGHPILALLKGSAVNQDGASNGLTAPNGPSQERVIRQALANARLSPKDVDAVEAHGTGTTLGDPIEAGALLATYGQDREQPLRLGSIKSNIGHTQAAAGVAGVIKMTQAMRAGVLPKTLHVDAPSSKVEWETGEIELLTEQLEWEAEGRPRRAGVSSFGISGTNAHVILEEAPGGEVTAEERAPLQGPIPLTLSAKAEPALVQAAERLAAHITQNPELDPTDVAYSLATTRSAFEHRAVALGEDREELLTSLNALANGEPSANLTIAKAKQGKLAYLLTGQGSQRLGMGRELYEQDKHFAEAFDRACEQIDAELGESLQEIIFAKGKKAQERLEDTTYAQPALFAIEVALHEALAKRGLKPDLLTGHSVGEIAAAQIAGVLSLPDAARLVVARGKLMGELPTGGAMVAIEATEQEATESIAGKEQELSIAGINSPTSIVLSGAEEAIEEAEDHWQSEGRKTKRLAVSHAFHSPLMEPMLEEFAEVAQSLTFNEPQIPVISNLTGEILSKEQATDPAYWVSHAREPVRFAQGIETLAAQGASAYIELGPDPVLLAMARECLAGSEAEAAFIPTLREGRREAGAIATALVHAHAAGTKLDWGTFFSGTGARQVPLPTYPFQRKRYWLDSSGQLVQEESRAALHRVEWQAAASSPVEGTDSAIPHEVEVEVEASKAEAARRATEETLAAIQAFLADESKADSRLALITRGAMATSQGESPDPAAAAVWGLVRSATSEHPGRFALIDTDGTEASEEAIDAALAMGAAEPQIALREGKALVPRLTRMGASEGEEPAKPLDPQRTVLITGGLSGLGALVARHLAATEKARHLLLVSRKGPEAKGADELRSELEELGAQVQIAACDVTDPKAIEELLAQIPAAHPLAAIVHSAGALDDGVLDSMDAERLATTMRPKADAAWHLHEQSKDLELSHFVLFSSAAGLLGGAAQSNYAAANTFLDALAALRQAEGLPATSLAWGVWNQRSNLAVDDADAGLTERMAKQIRQRLGFVPMGAEQGLRLLDAALGRVDPLLAPVHFDTASLRDQAHNGTLAPTLRSLVDLPEQQAQQVRGSLGALLSEKPSSEHEAIVLDLVRSNAAAVLGYDSPAEVEPNKAFQEMGLDSLGAIELRNRLAGAAGLEIGATVVFDYPNSTAMAEHLLAGATASGTARQVILRAQASDEPIAIVGMACRYPGGIASPEDLWQLVAEGRDGITEFPADRGWDVDRLYHPDPDHPGTSYTREGGFLLDAAEFERRVLRHRPARSAGHGSPAAPAARILLGGARGRRH